MSKKKQDGEIRWTDDRFKGKSYIGSYSSIKQAMEALQEAADAEARGEWRNLSIQIVDAYDSQILVIGGQRLETDAERLKREKLDEDRADYRRKMYEQLKKEFGD